MGLSYDTNWDAFQYLEYPTSFSLPELMDVELQQSLLFNQSSPCIDSIFDPNVDENYLTSESEPCMYQYPYLYPLHSIYDSKPYLSDRIVEFSTTVEKVPEEFRYVHGPKACMSRDIVDFSTTTEKLPMLHYLSESKPNPYGALTAEKLPEFHHLSEPSYQSKGYIDLSTIIEKLPKFQTEVSQPAFSIGSGGKSDNTLSAQSVAARNRRKKITERTQELGKLVPGGHKMNTAEMFGAAYKYIKYLQAQVGMLELLNSSQENEEDQQFHSEEFQKLISSSKIQEKLYSLEKCLVPKKLVQTIANDKELHKSNPTIEEEIQQLIQKSG